MTELDVLALCEYWDRLSKGETPTTRQIREALARQPTCTAPGCEEVAVLKMAGPLGLRCGEHFEEP